MVFVSVNPATDIVIDEYPIMNRDEAFHLADRVHDAFSQWRTSGLDHRARFLKKAASLLRERKKEYGRLMSLEMGKPLAESEAELEKCAWVCEYYAEKGAQFLEPRPIETDAYKSFVAFEPLGAVLAIMPWNFPFWQVFRFAAPALMAGNTFVLKHAPNVTGCALAIETIIRDAGFPADAGRVLLAEIDVVAELIGRTAIRGGYPDRQHARGPFCRGDRGSSPQENGFGIGRQRSLSHSRGRGHRRGRERLRHLENAQRRTKLYCRQTLYRGRSSAQTFPGGGD